MSKPPIPEDLDAEARESFAKELGIFEIERDQRPHLLLAGVGVDGFRPALNDV